MSNAEVTSLIALIISVAGQTGQPDQQFQSSVLTSLLMIKPVVG
jgi:hypothetical protein